MDMLSQNRKQQYRSALYTERTGLSIKVIPVLMSLAALFALFFLGVYTMLGKPKQWLVMLESMFLTFSLFTIAYLLALRRHPDFAVYIVVIALNQLGAGGALALEGWFAMSVLLAYVGIACARLMTGRTQNWIVVVMTTLSVIIQILITYLGFMEKYSNPISVQILLWIGYAISGLFVVGFIADIQDKRQEQLLEQVGDTADQLKSKTTTLEKQTVVLQRRTDFLENVIRVIQELGNPPKTVDIVTLIVQSIQKHFGFYHVAYYEAAGSLAPVILLDAAGEEADRWKGKDFKVLLDIQDPIATVARLGRPVVSSQQAPSISHTALMKSRITVPINTTQAVVTGVLDIQDRYEGSFQQNELLLIQILGAQISLALAATLRFEKVNQRLEEVMKLLQESSLASWREWIHSNPNLTYRYAKDRAARTDLPDDGNDNLFPPNPIEYALPIASMHGGTLGQVTAHKKNDWTKEEMALLETLIKQVEQTIENARLYQATQLRAAREQMTRRVTDSIRSAITVEEAIRLAVTELAQVVDASEVSAQLNVVGETQAEQGDNNG
jgi:GAF domain-containing protein